MTGNRFRWRRVAVGIVGLAVGALSTGALAAAGRQQAAPRQDAKPLTVRPHLSLVLKTDTDIVRFSVTDPEIADGLVVSPRELLVQGKKPGTTSLIVWTSGRTGAMSQYELVVEPDVAAIQQKIQTLFPGEGVTVSSAGAALVLTGRASSAAVVDRVLEVVKAVEPDSRVVNIVQLSGAPPATTPVLQERLRTLFPGEDIQVSMSGKATILSGRVSSKDVLARVAEVAEKTEPGSAVINLLQIPPSPPAGQQVLLKVRIAEASRKKITEYGSKLFNQSANPATGVTARVGPAGEVLDLFFPGPGWDVGAIFTAMQRDNVLNILAEPNLIAYNGKKADFLAGGKVPVLIPAGNGGAPTIQYQEYGVGLSFTPTVEGDTIRLLVRPEVSDLDRVNSVSLNGTVVPALTTRWATTEVALKDGQSFVIAGLISTSGSETKSGVPFLSKVPLLGYLFSNRQKEDDRKELLVLITPHLVQPLNADQVPPLPKIIRKEQSPRP
jgi:pilus assembly protein CpaC